MSLRLAVHGLEIRYDAFPVLQGTEFTLQPGELAALIGANGAGKSTLLRTISKVIQPTEGSIYLDTREIKRISTRETARMMAVVPQDSGADFEFTVEDIVLMGRLPYLGRFQKEGEKDRDAAFRAMEMTGVDHLARRFVTSLSGGEKQRVMIARAICQEPRLMLLDEPTANLDIGYQSALLDLAVKLNREKGVTIIAAIHDLNLAVQYFDRFLLLAEGKVLASGRAEEVFTEVNIKTSYGVPATIYRHPLHGRLQVSVARGRPPVKEAKKLRVHVIAGGEEALPTLELLLSEGFELSVGPVSNQDSGYRFAAFYRLPVLEVPPFSPVAPALNDEHLQLMEKADYIVVPPIPLGEGNLRNLEAVEQALDRGRSVLLLQEDGAPERDYTGGKARELLRRMWRKGALPCGSLEEMLRVLYGGRGEDSSGNEKKG